MTGCYVGGNPKRNPRESTGLKTRHYMARGLAGGKIYRAGKERERKSKSTGRCAGATTVHPVKQDWM